MQESAYGLRPDNVNHQIDDTERKPEPVSIVACFHSELRAPATRGARGTAQVDYFGYRVGVPTITSDWPKGRRMIRSKASINGARRLDSRAAEAEIFRLRRIRLCHNQPK